MSSAFSRGSDGGGDAGGTYRVTLRKRRRSARLDPFAMPGFSRCGTRFHPRWERGRVPASELPGLEAACRRAGFSVEVLPECYTRSSSYRRDFIAAFPGPWRCRYCNELLEEESLMTVDHVVPVAAASRSRLARWYVDCFCAGDVNSVGNLVPSCSGCNSRKASKVGLWPLRAFLGRFKVWWAFVYIVEASALLAALWAVWQVLSRLLSA